MKGEMNFKMNAEEVKKAKQGNKDILGNLIMENMKSLYRVAFSILKSEDEISDAISNTVVIIYEKISTLKNEEFFKTWITRILINECYKIYNQNKKIIYLDNYNQDNLSYNDQYADFEIRKIIKNLDKDLQEIVILYYYEDFGVKDISKLLKIPEGTVKSRLSRARTKLEKELLEKKIDERGSING